MAKVRVNSKYFYYPVMMDELQPPFGNPVYGQQVKVINRYGCPKANVMGMCYIQSLDGEFLGMVCTNSLSKTKRTEVEDDFFDFDILGEDITEDELTDRMLNEDF